jgi:hypothetical protein
MNNTSMGKHGDKLDSLQVLKKVGTTDKMKQLHQTSSYFKAPVVMINDVVSSVKDRNQ